MINILVLPIILPLIAALIVFFTPRKTYWAKEIITLFATGLNFGLAILLFGKKLTYSLPWLGRGLDFSLRLDHFSSFILIFACGFGFLVAMYSSASLRQKDYAKPFYAYFLITLSFVSAVLLSDNLLLLLFFWEGLLLTLFGMIAIGNKSAFKTATKAFIIVGITDLCMMVGIAITGNLAGTLAISQINLPLGNLASLAFILLMIGAISKAGSMPFHSWIPDAAIDAPLPFMALIPGAIEKLVGIYFLSRICLEMFQMNTGSWLSVLLMSVGAITIILAVMMALVQKDYKRLLSYHAISQVGYMILGIGTAVPAGIIGGLFHMINNALYKSGLFLTAGAVEKQSGTTNLEKLGGIGKNMPVTFACFIITALSISGVPPFNGFFSKELVYDGALERGLIFYIVAVLGSFFTAASFLKLGHAAFMGKIKEENKKVKEAPLVMLIPMIVIALTCIIFGLYNTLPINRILLALGETKLLSHGLGKEIVSVKLLVITLIVLAAAFLNHLFGVKSKGSGLKAVDHIHYAPFLKSVYDMAEKRFFDPYDIGLKIIGLFSKLSWFIDRSVDWLYDNFSVKFAFAFTNKLRKLHTGNYSVYLAWALAGSAGVILFLMYSV